ncbi:sulfate transporter CysZ [bacterium]|nr:MAG: sulfate transporter CysZ [bacterium]
MFNDFLSGLTYFFKGIRMIFHPGLRRFVIIPLIINIVIFTAAILVGIDQFDTLLDWLMPQGEAWWIEFARVILWILFSAMISLIVFFTFTLIANLLGAPFNGLLSEKVERSLSGEIHEEEGGVRLLLASIFPSLLSEARKMAYFLIFAAVVLILSLFIHVLSPLLWGIFASWMFALEYIAYPMENHGIYFSKTRAQVRKKRAISFGFGMAVMFATMIPLVNFLVMPSAVAGATILWVERLNRTAGKEIE